MKNIYELMRQKEIEFDRVRNELQALRIVAPLLEEELTAAVLPAPPPAGTDRTIQVKPVAAPSDTKPIWP